jgi:hypothetical protein
MYFRYTRPRALSELRRPLNNWTELRRHFPIAIIDDEEFVHFSALTKHGFVLQQLGDIADISAVAAYPVVSCDIKGVGASFGSPLEGAHLIAEVKKRFPDKYVIAYSAGAFGPEYKRALDFSDVFLRRGASIDEWTECLDIAIRRVGDPVEYWKRIRMLLLTHEVSTFEVFLLEDAFITSITNHDEFVLTKALQRAKKLQSVGDVLESVSHGLITVAKLAITAL